MASTLCVSSAGTGNEWSGERGVQEGLPHSQEKRAVESGSRSGHLSGDGVCVPFLSLLFTPSLSPSVSLKNQGWDFDKHTLKKDTIAKLLNKGHTLRFKIVTFLSSFYLWRESNLPLKELWPKCPLFRGSTVVCLLHFLIHNTFSSLMSPACLPFWEAQVLCSQYPPVPGETAGQSELMIDSSSTTIPHPSLSLPLLCIFFSSQGNEGYNGERRKLLCLWRHNLTGSVHRTLYIEEWC